MTTKSIPPPSIRLDENRRPGRNSPRTYRLPFLDLALCSQQHDLLVLNQREDLTDDGSRDPLSIFNVDFP